MREKAEQLLAYHVTQPPQAEETCAYGDRIEHRRLWAASVEAESLGLYGAAQVFVVHRQVIPLSPTVSESSEHCYAVSSLCPLSDVKSNAAELLRGFRGHWGIESKNHNRRDVTYREDRSPVKHHQAARALAAMKILAIFLCQIGAHRPGSERERTLPEFHRSCALNGIDRALSWLKRKHNPLAD